ncbi:MAG: glycosyltransferase family 4 protein [Sumerlaeia bacterium]
MPKRHFLFCNYEYPPIGGGGSTMCQHMAKTLVGLGHTVEVVTAAFSDLPRFEDHGALTIRRVPALRKLAGQSNPKEMLSYAFSAAPRLLFRKGPLADIIVSFHSIPSGLVGWPVSRLRGIPHIVRFGGGDVPGWLPGDLERMHRLTLPINRAVVYSADAAIANSDGLRSLAQKAFPKKEIETTYNAVDTGFYRPAQGPRPDGPVRLFFAGRMTSQKGMDTLLDALNFLKNRDLPEWRLDAAGEGPMLESFETRARDHGLADRVAFPRFLSRDKVLEGYQRADLFAFPSRYEGMPCVVLEAMACGLPIVGTRIMGTEQLVADNENGFLVPPDRPEELADVLAKVIADSALRARLGQKSRELAEAEWSWTRRAVDLSELAERVIERHARKRNHHGGTEARRK